MEAVITESMRFTIFLCLVGVALSAAGDVRQPAVAGSFYTDDPDALRAQVETMLDEAGSDTSDTFARALVVPHAGYAYSGPTAAAAFALLPSEGVRRIVLLGPTHHFSFSGGALPDSGVTAFETPLGSMPLDQEALKILRGKPHFGGPANAHKPEHSLEVELPFLQVVAPEAKLVPIAVGTKTDLQTCREMAESISKLLDAGTIVIASSDFTHHGSRYGWTPYDGPELPDTLLSVARETADRVIARDARGFLKQIEVSGDTVCGARPVGILTALLEGAFNGEGSVLEITTSGHVTGSFDLSVSYVSMEFHGDWRSWREPAQPEFGEVSAAGGTALVELARAVLTGSLTHDTGVAGWFAKYAGLETLQMPAGAFVTINNTGRRARSDGRLRACMGLMGAEQPLLDAVIQAALMAARDPRFPPLRLDELEDVEIEVSVLSPMGAVRSPRFIQVGEHGVLMAKDGRRAVFLPQVATEQGWTRDEMLGQLSLKAGLARKAWQHGATFEVFTAQVFSETE
jgi:AmmeMemoRadiSam system protein B/AmmeMemoRadiSam system protein A